MARFKNIDWNLPTKANGGIDSWNGVTAALLMDIRDELQVLNRLLGCHNFLRVPRILDDIAANTKKPTRKRAK